MVSGFLLARVLDLHSGRSQVDLNWLSAQLGGLGADTQIQACAKNANNANEVLQIAQEFGLDIAGIVAEKEAEQAKMILKHSQTNINIIVVDRSGRIVGQTD